MDKKRCLDHYDNHVVDILKAMFLFFFRSGAHILKFKILDCSNGLDGEITKIKVVDLD
jgi:hypothetical protein